MFYVDTLTLSAFRGIPGELTVRFDAPLTLIYAPNGIGKTSLCDGIEWLLTGGVNRLDFVPDDSWRCRHANTAQPTFVSCNIQRGNDLTILRRDWGQDGIIATSQGTAPTRWTASTLLDWLVPRVAAEFSDARSRNPRRREWIKATQFLGTERLALLMDSDPSSRVRREQIFADLLGVGQLQRLVPRFKKALDAAKRQNSDCAAEYTMRKSHVAEIEKQLSQAGATGDLDAIRLVVKEASASLEMPPPGEAPDVSDASLSETLHQLTEIATQRKLTADGQAPSWSSLQEWLSFERGRGPAVIAQAERMIELTDQKHESDQRLENARQQSSQLLAKKEEQARKTAHLDEGTAEIQTALPLLESYADQERLQRVGLSDLFRRATDVAPSTMSTLAKAAKTLKQGLAEAGSRSAQLKDAEARLAQMPGEASLTRQLDEATKLLGDRREAAADLKMAWESVASIEQQILELGREFADKHATSGQCPLCTHDWKTLEALRAAIERATGATPSAVDGRASTLSQAQQAVRDAERNTENARSALETRRKLAGTASALNEQLQALWHNCEILGLPTSRVPDATQVEISISQIETRRAASDTARRLEPLLVENESDDAQAPWRERLEVEIRRRESLRAEARTQMAKLDSDWAVLSKAIAQDEEASALVNQRLAEAEKAAAELASIQQNRDAAAESLDLGQSPTRDTIERSMREWDIARKNLGRVCAMLNSASQSLLALQWREQLKQRQAALEAALLNRRAASRRVDQLTRLEEMLNTQLNEAKTQRVGSLRTAVEALFLKMHAARIAESVEATDDMSSFSVRIGEWMSNAEQLSQGQRQDLALSIFLARARAYGGTFFLDEPLLHLDDLNRVALLDVLRAIGIQDGPRIRLVVTTASSVILTHLRQKCRSIKMVDDKPIMRAYQLVGTVRDNVEAQEVDV